MEYEVCFYFVINLLPTFYVNFLKVSFFYYYYCFTIFLRMETVFHLLSLSSRRSKENFPWGTGNVACALVWKARAAAIEMNMAAHPVTSPPEPHSKLAASTRVRLDSIEAGESCENGVSKQLRCHVSVLNVFFKLCSCDGHFFCLRVEDEQYTQQWYL